MALRELRNYLVTGLIVSIPLIMIIVAWIGIFIIVPIVAWILLLIAGVFLALLFIGVIIELLGGSK